MITLQNELKEKNDTIEFISSQTSEMKKEINNVVTETRNAFNSIQIKMKQNEDFFGSLEERLELNKIEENSDLNEFKNLLQEKILTDQQVFLKEKEKSKALFNEVIRISEQQEKQNKNINSVYLENENRIQNLENKLISFERNSIEYLTKDEQLKQLLDNIKDKTQMKLNELETDFFQLKKECLRNEENLRRLEEFKNKLNKEMREITETGFEDLNTKIDQSIKSLNYRIENSNEERKRSHEYLNSQLDLKTKLYEEKLAYDREEMKDKYLVLEELLRVEKKKTEQLHEVVENKLESMQKNYLQRNMQLDEEMKESERNLQTSLNAKLMELNSEIEQMKEKIENDNDNIGELVKEEITARFSSDVQLKNLAGTIFGTLTKEIKEFKEFCIKQNEVFFRDMKVEAEENSKRANNLMRFFENEIEKTKEDWKTKFNSFGDSFENFTKNYHEFKQDAEKSLKEKDILIDSNKKEILKEFEIFVIDNKENLNNKISQVNFALNEVEKNLESLGKRFIDDNELIRENMKKKFAEFEKFWKEEFDKSENRFQELNSNFSGFKKKIENFVEKEIKFEKSCQSSFEQTAQKIEKMEDRFSENLENLKSELIYEMLKEKALQEIFEETFLNEFEIIQNKYLSLQEKILKNENEYKENNVNQQQLKNVKNFFKKSLQQLQNENLKKQEEIEKNASNIKNLNQITKQNYNELISLTKVFEIFSKSKFVKIENIQNELNRFLKLKLEKHEESFDKIYFFIQNFYKSLEEFKNYNNQDMIKKLDIKILKMYENFKSHNDKLRKDFVNYFKKKGVSFEEVEGGKSGSFDKELQKINQLQQKIVKKKLSNKEKVNNQTEKVDTIVKKKTEEDKKILLEEDNDSILSDSFDRRKNSMLKSKAPKEKEIENDIEETEDLKVIDKYSKSNFDNNQHIISDSENESIIHKDKADEQIINNDENRILEEENQFEKKEKSKNVKNENLNKKSKNLLKKDNKSKIPQKRSDLKKNFSK